MVVWELLHLFGGSFDEPFLVVTKINRPQSSQAIQDPEESKGNLNQDQPESKYSYI
jgi:hypothetical protein